jgi:hypothetical protein
LQEDTNLKLCIEGHTDSDGSDFYNLVIWETSPGGKSLLGCWI